MKKKRKHHMMSSRLDTVALALRKEEMGLMGYTSSQVRDARLDQMTMEARASIRSMAMVALSAQDEWREWNETESRKDIAQ